MRSLLGFWLTCAALYLVSGTAFLGAAFIGTFVDPRRRDQMLFEILVSLARDLAVYRLGMELRLVSDEDEG